MPPLGGAFGFSCNWSCSVSCLLQSRINHAICRICIMSEVAVFTSEAFATSSKNVMLTRFCQVTCSLSTWVSIFLVHSSCDMMSSILRQNAPLLRGAFGFSWGLNCDTSCFIPTLTTSCAETIFVPEIASFTSNLHMVVEESRTDLFLPGRKWFTYRQNGWVSFSFFPLHALMMSLPCRNFTSFVRGVWFALQFEPAAWAA